MSQPTRQPTSQPTSQSQSQPFRLRATDEHAPNAATKDLGTPLFPAHEAHSTSVRRNTITTWLDIMVGMVRAPANERAAIRAELETHIRDRARDFQISGVSEAESIARAIAELGDAASLAKRYQEAIQPSFRRRIMLVGTISAATAALIISAATLFSQSGGTGSGSGSAGGGGGNSSGGGTSMSGVTAPIVAAVPAVVTDGVQAASEREISVQRELEELRDQLSKARVELAEQDRALSRARGEVESLQMRLVGAEGRALNAEEDAAQLGRMQRDSMEGQSNMNDRLKEALQQRDKLMRRVEALTKAQKEQLVLAPPAVYEPPVDPSRETLDKVEIVIDQIITPTGFIERLKTKIPTFDVRMNAINATGIPMDAAVAIPVGKLSMSRAIDEINTSITSPDQRLVVRTKADGTLALTTQMDWDQSDLSLVVYDIRDLIEASHESIEAPKRANQSVAGGVLTEMREVITRTVMPEIWQGFAGDISKHGTFMAVNGTLIITAPSRAHHKIDWLLQRCRADVMRVPVLSDLPIAGEAFTTSREAGSATQAQPVAADTVQAK